MISNMSLNTLFVFATLALFMVTSTFGHSQMRCAKYDQVSGVCNAPIRNSAVAFEEEDNDMSTGGGICQSPMTNPISASYSNGAGCPDYAPCPDPMGTFQQGENFTIMWLARNHAEADETPGNIDLYISPVEAMNQGVDVSTAVFLQTKICEAPFTSCLGQNGNFVQCYTTCTMPTNTVVGVHTLWWRWVWSEVSAFNIYTTCADIYVTAASGPAHPVTPVPATTGAAKPSTTGAARPSTTGAARPSTPVSTTGAARPPVSATTGAARPVTPPTTGAARPSTTGAARPSTPVTPPSTPSTGCNLGDQLCVGTSQYQTCTNGRDSTYWAAPQNCNAATTCQKSTNPASLNKIYCM